MKENKVLIISLIKRAGKKGISYQELMRKARMSAKERAFSSLLRELRDSGEITEQKGKYITAKRAGLHEAVIERVNKTFGFARQADNEQEIFIPGKFLKGALPGDVVQVRYIPARREGGLEGEVVNILSYGSGTFSGVLVVSEKRSFAVLPDRFARFPIPVMKGQKGTFQPGDKVMAQVTIRGLKHGDHRCKILESFGDSQSAAACADAILKLNHVPQEFSSEAEAEAEQLAARGMKAADYKNRLDLRDEIIFTIDSADSKDLDDAVSLVKLGDCYQLGVHIADVSHYVTVGSKLEQTAFERGTSIYYADRVVPMLPKPLSNGICSLNPGEDRLAFSALLTISEKGELLDYDFKKSVICSRVKGVYREVNQLLAHTASPEILEKYAGLTDSIALMEQLADILAQNKKNRGAPEIETTESKIIIGKDGEVLDIRPRERGKSERIIEEFMLMANQAAASLARQLSLPFVYRVHEAPDSEKIESLKEILHALGLSVPKFKKEIQPGQLAAVLAETKGGKYDALVNTYVLRSMAKAKYSEQPIGHFGLVLQDYAHFTSPIRRYPDLAIHRILSGLVSGSSAAAVQKKYNRFAPAAALQSTRTELRAMQAERDCEDCYKAAYMTKHLGEPMEGIISSVAGQGAYVELPNTVEGLVRIESLGEDFSFDGLMELRNREGKRYRIGDSLCVVCVRADVNSGQIDFELARQ